MQVIDIAFHIRRSAMPIPTSIAYLLLAGDFAIIAALLFGLRQTLARAGWRAEERAAILRRAGLILFAWYAVALALSWSGFFAAGSGRIPTIEIGVFGPILLGAFMLWRSGTLGRILDAVPQSWLVGVQVYRTIGVVFLVLLQLGQLPGAFAWPAGLGDMLTGLAAPIVALLYARDSGGAAPLVRAWNLLGLLDLVTAVAIGFLTSPSPLQLISTQPPNELVSAFPLVMIPVFAVPIAAL